MKFGSVLNNILMHNTMKKNINITLAMVMAVYDGCGIVAFVYWLRLKQFVVPMKAQSHLWL